MNASKIVMISLAALVGQGLLTVEPAHSGQQGDPPKCSLATLNGLYMFAQSGYATISGSLVPEGVTGKDIFHGNGAFDSLAAISIAGTIIEGDAAPGTYTINSDCTGTVTVHMQPPTQTCTWIFS